MSTVQEEDSCVDLLFELECSAQFMDSPGIMSLTFMKGSTASAAASLRETMGKILALNPWLNGRLVKRKGMPRVGLEYLRSAPDSAASKLVACLDAPIPGVRHGGEYSHMTKQLNKPPYDVDKGSKLVNKNKPVFQVRVKSKLTCILATIFPVAGIAR